MPEIVKEMAHHVMLLLSPPDQQTTSPSQLDKNTP
jgi:hypothetical protein